MSKESIDERLLTAQVRVDNTLNDPEILSRVSEFGYNADRMTEGKALQVKAAQLHQKQMTEYGEQYQASSAVKAKWEEAEKPYMVYLETARVPFKREPAIMVKLGLAGDRKTSFSGWLTQARQFYTNALNDSEVLAKLGQFGITEAKLQAGQQLLDELEAANTDQEKEKGEAQQATADRDVALDEMDDWVSDYTAIARIALADKPQLLEKLGIVVRS